MKKFTGTANRIGRDITSRQAPPERVKSPSARTPKSLQTKVMIRDVRTVLIAPPVDDGRRPATTATLVHVLSSTYELATEAQENLVAAYLDSRGRIIGTERVYRGTFDRATVSTSDAIRTALLLNARGIVVAHNHPSGDPTPSREDINFTRELADAVGLFRMRLVDHIVIAGEKYRSMAADGHLR